MSLARSSHGGHYPASRKETALDAGDRVGVQAGAGMSEPPALRASDADREHAVELLREHAAAGRLTLEEFTERMSAAYGALTNEELAELTRDLPVAQPASVSRRSPTRWLFSVFASTERQGRIRVRRRVVCLTML